MFLNQQIGKQNFYKPINHVRYIEGALANGIKTDYPSSGLTSTYDQGVLKKQYQLNNNQLVYYKEFDTNENVTLVQDNFTYTNDKIMSFDEKIGTNDKVTYTVQENGYDTEQNLVLFLNSNDNKYYMANIDKISFTPTEKIFNDKAFANRTINNITYINGDKQATPIITSTFNYNGDNLISFTEGKSQTAFLIFLISSS